MGRAMCRVAPDGGESYSSRRPSGAANALNGPSSDFGRSEVCYGCAAPVPRSRGHGAMAACTSCPANEG